MSIIIHGIQRDVNYLLILRSLAKLNLFFSNSAIFSYLKVTTIYRHLRILTVLGFCVFYWYQILSWLVS